MGDSSRGESPIILLGADMAKEVGEMIQELAKRVLPGEEGNYGGQESRSAILILSAIDTLMLAAQNDAPQSSYIYKAIDILKQGVTGEKHGGDWVHGDAQREVPPSGGMGESNPKRHRETPPLSRDE